MNTQPFGLLNLNKPSGMSSRRAVDVVAKLVKPAKAGHAGTLDPLATGVLVVCVGAATRLVPYIQDQPKTYRGRFLLGRTSNTDDIEGEVTLSADPGNAVTAEQIESKLQKFVGQIEQVPPQFSAVHVNGKRAYKLARRGQEVEIAAKQVEVFRIELKSYQHPELELEIECGSGMYVRSIGRDLGSSLGCGAVMSELVRTRIGPFDISNSMDVDDLNSDSLGKAILPASKAVEHFKKHTCSEEELIEIGFGRLIYPGCNELLSDGEAVALLKPDGELAGVARYREEDRSLGPKQVFVTD